MDGLVDRCLIQATFAGDPARALGLALPFGVGDLGQSLFEDQAVRLGERFDALQDLANGLTDLETSLGLART
jgi:hypothetical protein